MRLIIAAPANGTILKNGLKAQLEQDRRISSLLDLSDLEQTYPQLSFAVAQKIAPQRSYRCDECGFRHHSLIWHCPACSRWSSFRPLLEIKFRQ